MLGRKEEAPWQLHTCEHAFIHHTASINQNSITWQWQFSWKNEDVSRNQKTRLQLLQTYTTARFPWLAELFLFLFKNERDWKLISTSWQELPCMLTCSSPFPLNHRFPGTRIRSLISGPWQRISWAHRRYSRALVHRGFLLCRCFLSLAGFSTPCSILCPWIGACCKSSRHLGCSSSPLTESHDHLPPP